MAIPASSCSLRKEILVMNRLNSRWETFRYCVETIGTAIVTVASGHIILNIARAVRGYGNPGGELFLIPIIFALTLWGIHKAMNRLEAHLNAELAARERQARRTVSQDNEYRFTRDHKGARKAAQNF